MANTFGNKHARGNRVIAMETTKDLLQSPEISRTLVNNYKQLKIGPSYLPTLRKCCKCCGFFAGLHKRMSQTDRRTNIMAIARRFVLANASRAKKLCVRHTPCARSIIKANSTQQYFIISRLLVSLKIYQLIDRVIYLDLAVGK